jgi:probable rRNA maturation factor
MSVVIDVEHSAWQSINDLESLARRVAEAALQGRAAGDVCLLFTGDDDMGELNRTWRGQDKPTNVLSFPAPTDMPVPKGEMAPLGDVALAYETVLREAAEQGKTPVDHLSHLIVHGILHLLGYDHETGPDAEAMETEEREILARLGIADPYSA